MNLNHETRLLEEFSVRVGQAVEDLMLSDVMSSDIDVIDVVERHINRFERITDRLGD